MTQSNAFGLWQADNIIDQAMPISPSVTYYQDSNVYWDTVSETVLPLSNDTNAANFAGVIREVNPVSVYGETSTPNQPSALCRVTKSGQFLRYVTAGETYHPGTKVCAGADAQTVTTVGSNYIGYVSFEQADVVTATAGAQILVDHRVKQPYGIVIS
jgi:hypothetical protein